jgi:AbiV family abortive infection protein
MTPFKPEVLKAMEACRSHAKDAFEGAQLLRQHGKPNLAYHLATIALEELGKGQLIGMRSFAKEDDDSWHTKQINDHVKKLFWALWGRFLGTIRPDPKETERLRELATIIHENRLRGLYVDPNPENFVAPIDAVTDGILDPLMALVESKLVLSPSFEGVVYSQDDLDLLSWFSNVTDDPEKRSFVFSKQSFDKLDEVGAKEWLRWIKSGIERAEIEANAFLQKELTRGFTTGDEGLEYKWELKIRIFSQSHSIRPKSLNFWNDKVTWVKLYPVDKKKNHLDVTFKIPKFITIDRVYQIGFGFSNLFIAALNIASCGFFWWHEPKNLSTFFESFVDTEEKRAGVIRRTPELRIGWPPAVLDEGVLNRAMNLFAVMPRPYDIPEENEPLSHYMTGIALLAKTDVFLQFELQSYGAFVYAVDSAIKLYQPQLTEGLKPIDVDSLLASLDKDDPVKIKHTALIAQYRCQTLKQGAITMAEVAEMKQLAEAVLTASLAKRIQELGKKPHEDGDKEV